MHSQDLETNQYLSRRLSKEAQLVFNKNRRSKQAIVAEERKLYKRLTAELYDDSHIVR